VTAVGYRRARAAVAPHRVSRDVTRAS